METIVKRYDPVSRRLIDMRFDICPQPEFIPTYVFDAQDTDFVLPYETSFYLSGISFASTTTFTMTIKNAVNLSKIREIIFHSADSDLSGTTASINNADVTTDIYQNYYYIYLNTGSILTNTSIITLNLPTQLSLFTRITIQNFVPCIAAGSLITLFDGSTKLIEDISYDDDLAVWDFDNGILASAKPLWIKRAQTSNSYNRLVFSDGSELKTLLPHLGHRIFNKEKGKFTYPMTDETPIGTHTYTYSGNEVELIDKYVVDEEVVYYNINTTYHINLFANGILTSCRYNNIYPIQNMKFIKESRPIIPRSAFEGIPDKYYEGMRLGEQTISIEDTIKYITIRENLAL